MRNKSFKFKKPKYTNYFINISKKKKQILFLNLIEKKKVLYLN